MKFQFCFENSSFTQKGVLLNSKFVTIYSKNTFEPNPSSRKSVTFCCTDVMKFFSNSVFAVSSPFSPVLSSHFLSWRPLKAPLCLAAQFHRFFGRLESRKARTRSASVSYSQERPKLVLSPSSKLY